MINKVLGYRKMLGMTQEQMAKRIGISENQYRSKEKGKFDFSSSEMKIFYKLVKEKIDGINLEDIFF